MQQCQVPHKTFKELSQQGELFKDILQRIILPAQFKAATASKCEFICMWIEGLGIALAFVKLDGQPEPRLKIECSLAYPGMTAGVCCMEISSSPITATFPFPNPFFEPGGSNPEVYLSKQSVNECDLSLLLMIDSHHQQ